MIKHDYAPKQNKKQENRFVTYALFAMFTLNGAMGLGILALAKTGPITSTTEVVGWANAVCCVVAGALAWNRKV